MPEYDFDIGILGGGAAGLTVASGASQFGAKTLLIEKEKVLGGDCLHYGCVPSKTLIKTAHVYHMMKNAKKYGLPDVRIVPVEYAKVAERIRSVIDVIQQHDSEERFCKLGVKVEFGDAEFVDEHSVRIDGKRYSAGKWVIATGSSPARLSVEGAADTPYVTNKEIFSLERLPASMIIIGGGPIAIEMAQAFCRLGSEVSVIHKHSQILVREDRDMADEIMRVLISEGVKFYLDAELLSTKKRGSEIEVIIKERSGDKLCLNAEKLMAAAGRQPNTDGLGLDKISLITGRKGIPVDTRMRTNHKHIYAAGDINGAYQFTHAAGYEGGVVLSNAVLHLPKKADYTYFPWCTYTDPELASIGMNEMAAKAAGHKYDVLTEEFRANDRSLAEGEETGRIKMIVDSGGKPLGIQILGPQAGVLISEWVAVLNGHVKLSALASAVHPYPTLGEINKRIAGNYFSEKIFSDKVRKTLKFFFHLKGRACE